MQQMLRAMGQNQLPAMKPTLEVNPDHEIVKKLLNATDDAMVNDAAWLLLEQALLIEGVPVPANTNGRVERRERLGGLLNSPTVARRECPSIRFRRTTEAIRVTSTRGWSWPATCPTHAFARIWAAW